MRDDQLRAQLAEWLRPAQQAQAPDISVIRRRLRRRRVRNTVAGAAICALAAGSVTVIHATTTHAPPPVQNQHPATPPHCAGRDLRVSRESLARGPQPTTAVGPLSYLLVLRNAAASACTLAGWPVIRLVGPHDGVTIVYGTVSYTGYSRGGSFVARVVEPTRVLLRPGESAGASVALSQVAACHPVNPRWQVTLPHGSGGASLPPLAGSGFALCQGVHIVVSPVYPARVPVSQNYPRAAPRQSPATLSTSVPQPDASPGAAPYFVTVDRNKVPARAVVRDWRTGRVTAVIQPPASAPQGFTGVAAAGDDQTFVLAAGGSHSRFYELTLAGASGKPSGPGRPGVPLPPLPVPPLATPGAPFAVSADGGELALALPDRGATRSTNEIVVVSLVSGAIRTWHSRDPGYILDLSWADPGSSPARGWAASSRLAFTWTDTNPGRRAAAHRSGLRLLDTTAPGVDLLASHLLIPASVRFGALRGISYPLIAADGNVVYGTMTSHAAGGAGAAVVEFSGTTGAPLRAVTPTTDESGFGTWCGALWADPAGTRMLAACGTQGESGPGGFAPVNLHFPAPNFSAGTGFFGW
jgi:hypothetical protein